MITQSRLLPVLCAGFLLSIATSCARTDDSYVKRSDASLNQPLTKPNLDNDPDLTNTDPGNGSGSGTGTGTGSTGNVGDVIVGGRITYDFVPATANGLDFNSVSAKPVRGALVEAVKYVDGTTVLSKTVTDADGKYQFPVASSTMTFIRVRARLYKTGTPSWDFKVVDNTRNKAMYVLDSTPFSSGVIDTPDKNLHAASGWTGSSYTTARVAGPFAILDVMYQNLQAVIASDANLILPMLQINWSVNNVPSSGTLTNGQITTTHYNQSEGQLYVLGKQDVDTDEYDTHIIAHEWAHYLENRFSRTDSLGGSHTLSASLDPRVAFSEGFANAFSGVATGDPVYNDTSGSRQALTQISFSLESRPAGASTGPYSETSVQTVLYNFFLDQGSGSAASFAPILAALRGGHKASTAFTTIYSFVDAIRTAYPASMARLNALLSTEAISTSSLDSFDSTHTEGNFAGLSGVKYLYRRLNLGDVPGTVCSRGEIGNFNRAYNRRFFYFVVPATRTYTIKAVPSTTGNPVIALYRQGVKLKVQDELGAGRTESLQISLGAGTYSGEVYESTIVNGSSAGSECFTLSLE